MGVELSPRHTVDGPQVVNALMHVAMEGAVRGKTLRPCRPLRDQLVAADACESHVTRCGCMDGDAPSGPRYGVVVLPARRVNVRTLGVAAAPAGGSAIRRRGLWAGTKPRAWRSRISGRRPASNGLSCASIAHHSAELDRRPQNARTGSPAQEHMSVNRRSRGRFRWVPGAPSALVRVQPGRSSRP